MALLGGILAARQGHFDAAKAGADKIEVLQEPVTSPRKLEPMHELLGHVYLLQGDYEKATEHFHQTNLNNIYTRYHLALAEEGVGNTDEAQRLYREVAELYKQRGDPDQARDILQRHVTVESLGPPDTAPGSPDTAPSLVLMEEVGELAAALRNGTPPQQAQEFADVLAWLTTIANVAGVDLTQAVVKKYGAGCPGCGRLVCICPDAGKP